MPLFESQTSRNEHWFRAARDTTNRILREEFNGEPEASTHGAWAEGGILLARSAVEHLTMLKEAWGKGTLDKALSLTRVFVQPMISAWYRAIDSNRPEKDRSRGVQLAAMNMLTLLGDRSQQAITDFLNLDLQFNYESDHFDEIAGVFTYHFELMMDKALVALGEPPAIDWRLQTFPLTQGRDLVWVASRDPMHLLRDGPMWAMLQQRAVAWMFEAFELCEEQRKQGLPVGW